MEPTKQEISQVFKRLRAVGPNKVSLEKWEGKSRNVVCLVLLFYYIVYYYCLCHFLMMSVM